jgi:DNA-binding XRE family transcriptional regulator
MSDDQDALDSTLRELETDGDASSQADVLDVAEAGRRRLCLKIREQRRSVDVSQAELARRIGTSQPAIARLEAGLADPKLSTLARYAAALGFELQFNWLPISERFTTHHAKETMGV